MTKYFIQTRSKTKTVTGDWFDFLGPYSYADAKEKTLSFMSDATNHEFRMVRKTVEVIELGETQ